MSDRRHVWTIVAEFSQLSKEANKAARAIKKLDEARNDANKNASKEVTSEEVYRKETERLDNLTEALQRSTAARRQATAAMQKAKTAQNDATIATTRSTTARRDETSSIKEQVDATHNLSTALGTNAVAARNVTAASTKNHRNNQMTARSYRQVTDAVSQTATQTSWLTRAVTDILPVSRSWGLVMKMLPLTGVTSAISTMIPTINALGGAFVGLMGTITPIFGTLGALPTMLTAVAGSIGGIVAGLKGVGGALKAHKEMEDAQTKASRKSSKSTEQAERNKQRSIRNTTRSLDRARRDQSRNAEAIAEAEANIATTARDNARAVADAEKAVASAQEESRRAQQGVNAAREAATRALSDYRRELQGAALDEESAALELSRARASLAAVLTDPGATDMERKSADLAVRQAEQRLEQVRVANRDLEAEAAEAQAKGIENSDQVVAARQAEVEAAEALADAQESLDRTHENNAKSMRGAEKSLESARQSYADGSIQVQDLEEDLANLYVELDNVGGGADAAAEKVAAFEEAMAKLPPAAQDVVHELIAMGDAWSEVQYRAQAAISPGVLSFLKDLRYTLLPYIADFLERMAGGAGEWAEELGDLLTTETSLRNLSLMFKDSYDFMELMGEATLNLIELFLGLGAAAEESGLTRWVGGVIESWTDGWASAVRTPEGVTNTAEGMRIAMHYSELWGEAIASTWNFLKYFFRAFRPLGEWMLNNITETTTRWREWLDTDSGRDKVRVWQELAEINLSGLGNMIRTITDQGKKMFDGIDFQAFWDALNGTGAGDGFINSLGDLLGIVDERMIITILDLGSAIMDVLREIGQAGAMDGVITFVGWLGDLVEVATTALEKIPGLSTAVVGLLGIFSAKKFMVAMGSLFGVTPVLDAVGRAKQQGYTRGDGLYTAATRQYLGFGNFNEDRTTERGNATYMARQEERRLRRSGVFVSGNMGPHLPQRRDLGPARREVRNANRALRAFPAGQAPTHDYLQAQKNAEAARANLTRIEKQLTTSAGRVTGAWGRVGGVFRSAGTGIVGMLGPVGLAIAAITALSAAFTAFSKYARKDLPELEEVANILDRYSRNEGALDDIFPKQGWASPTKNVEGMSSALARLAEVSGELETKWDKNWWIPFESSTASLKDETNALVEELNKVDEATQLDFTKGRAAVESIVTEMQELGTSSDYIIRSFPQTAKQVEDSLRDMAAAGYEVETSTDAVADVLAGKLPDGMVATTEGFMTLAEAAEKQAILLKGELTEGYILLENGAIVAADSQEALAEKTDKARRSAEEQNKKLEDTAQKARDAARRIDELNEAQGRAAENFMSAEEAQIRYNETLTESNEILKENGRSLNEAGTGFNLSTTAGANNARYFHDLARSMTGVADSMANTGATAAETNEYIRQQREVLIETLGQFGITGTAAEEYADKLGLIPNRVDTEIYLPNANITEEEINSLAKLIEDFPQDAKTEIMVGALTDGFDAAIRDIESGKYVANVAVMWVDPDSGGSGVSPAAARAYNSEFKKGRATGGAVFGPGTSTSDSIPAMLSDGEYVIRARAAQQIGYNTLHSLNRTGKIPGYATGGRVRVQKYATGGRVSGSGAGIAAMVGRLDVLTQSASNVGRWMSSWGTDFRGWWNGLWSEMAGTFTQHTGTISRLIGSEWSRMWSNAVDYTTSALTTIHSVTMSRLGSTVAGVRSYIPAMTSAWTAVMDAMKPPVKASIDFLNGTLGKMVVDVAAFYGVTDTPFPVEVPGFAEGGWTGAGTKHQPAGIVHADEYVINKAARRRIEGQAPGLLDHMNRKGEVPGYAKGGLVSLNGKTFTPRFAQAIAHAERLAGTAFRISQGGFRPRTSYSGTSHQGDAVDLTPVTPRIVAALRMAGIAAWDRTGKGNWNPHIHGVPLPGYGTPGGSAIWQAQDYLRGGDGLGGRDTGPRLMPIDPASDNLPSLDSFSNLNPFGLVYDQAILLGNRAKESLNTFTKTLEDAPWAQLVGTITTSLTEGVVGKLSGTLHSDGPDSFARGGWTGPGSRLTPAGIVHADEYVINKASRRRIERTSPGLLDHMNSTGTVPGYAEGGKVGDPAKWQTPRTLKNMKLYMSYLEKAQSLAQTKNTSVPETKAHVQLLENLLAFEGLLSRSAADGWFGKADTLAWTEWQKRAGYTATGKIDSPSFNALMKKYSIPYDVSTPYVQGVAQPKPEDVLLRGQLASNKTMAEYEKYLKTFKSMGLTHLVDYLRELGPTGIPDEYRDSETPVTGLQLAKNFTGKMSMAREYNEALKTASAFDNAKASVNAMEAKMEEMLELLTYGTEGPYGLQLIARELGISIDTAAQLYKRLNSKGSLKKLNSSRLTRLRGDVMEFDNLFKFAKGGLVPGVGNRDSVLSLLTPGELVIPKDVVSQLYKPSNTAVPTFADFSSRVASRKDSGDGGTSKVVNINTTIHNPVAEPSSTSIQKRVKGLATLGLFGGE